MIEVFLSPRIEYFLYMGAFYMEVSMELSNRKEMKLGLGEAIRRIIKLHARSVQGAVTPAQREELGLLMDALNEIEIDLGFDCNDDGVADTIEIFKQTAQTSCCRLTPTKGQKSTSRSAPTEERKASSSRRKSSRRRSK